MLRRTLLLGAAMLLAGCAANPTQAPAGSGALAADYVKGSIKSVVMLPVLHASKAAVYQPALQSELTLALQVKNKDLRFMATNEALTRLMTGDAAGQSRSVASAVFEQTPINAAELKKLHDVLGIDAAIVCGYQTAGVRRWKCPCISSTCAAARSSGRASPAAGSLRKRGRDALTLLWTSRCARV